jgi:hypothetical protein
MQGIEVRNSIEGEQPSLAIDDELPVPVLAGDLDDPRISIAPVVATSGDQTDAIALAFEAETVAVVFSLRRADSTSPAKPLGFLHQFLTRLDHRRHLLR